MQHLKTKSRLARAAMLLLMMVLTTVTAGAGSVKYYDPTAAAGQQM